VIEFPTTVATIVGRWACDGPDDLPAVRALQDLLALEPQGGSAAGFPAPAAVPGELAFFEQMRTWMLAFPPSAADQAYQQRFASLGLLDPGAGSSGPGAAQRRRLIQMWPDSAVQTTCRCPIRLCRQSDAAAASSDCYARLPPSPAARRPRGTVRGTTRRIIPGLRVQLMR
jgi:hypothetical protein